MMVISEPVCGSVKLTTSVTAKQNSSEQYIQLFEAEQNLLCQKRAPAMNAKRAEACLEVLSESEWVASKDTVLKLKREVQLLTRRVSEIRLTALYDKEK